MEELIREFFVWIGWQLYQMREIVIIIISSVVLGVFAVSIVLIVLLLVGSAKKNNKPKKKNMSKKTKGAVVVFFLISLLIFVVFVVSTTYFSSVSFPDRSVTVAPYNWKITLHKTEKFILQNPEIDLEELIEETKETKNCQELAIILVNLQRLEEIKNKERELITKNQKKLDDYRKKFAPAKKELEEYRLKYLRKN